MSNLARILPKTEHGGPRAAEDHALEIIAAILKRGAYAQALRTEGLAWLLDYMAEEAPTLRVRLDRFEAKYGRFMDDALRTVLGNLEQ